MKSHDNNRQQLLVAFGYDGARFRGLQPQGPAIPTAGQTLKERLLAASGGLPPKALNFAARTDAGVHAVRNLATCYWRDPPLPGSLADVIAAIERPRDDGLFQVKGWAVPSHVHARGSARGKRYRYLVEDRAQNADPKRPWVWAVAPELDVDRMRRAAAHLRGTHDFSSLRAADCDANNPEKTLSSLRIGGPFVLDAESATSPRRYVIEVAGDAFLRKMMRNLTALLVEVGAGLRDPDDVTAILAARSRQAAGICAPPQGLTLLAVGCTWPDDGSLLLPEMGAEPRPISTPSS